MLLDEKILVTGDVIGKTQYKMYSSVQAINLTQTSYNEIINNMKAKDVEEFKEFATKKADVKEFNEISDSYKITYLIDYIESFAKMMVLRFNDSEQAQNFIDDED